MKSKEALKMLETRCRFYATDKLEIEETYEARKVIEKDLEILEIIKNKLPDMALLKVCKTLKEYNEYYNNIDYYETISLTQEEFNILKEMQNEI